MQAAVNETEDDDCAIWKYAQEMAAKFDLVYEELQGSAALTQKLLHSPWDDEILVAESGEDISLKVCISAGKFV